MRFQYFILVFFDWLELTSETSKRKDIHKRFSRLLRLLFALLCPYAHLGLNKSLSRLALIFVSAARPPGMLASGGRVWHPWVLRLMEVVTRLLSEGPLHHWITWLANNKGRLQTFAEITRLFINNLVELHLFRLGVALVLDNRHCVSGGLIIGLD